MQRALPVIAVLTLSLLTVPAGAAPLLDYVDNGGFETFEDNDPAQWRVLNGTADPTAEAAEGDLAVVLTIPGDELEAGIAQNITLENDDLPTPSGTFYDLNFSALLSTGQETPPTTSPEAQAVVIWKNLFGQEVNRTVIEIQASKTYEDHEITMQAPLPDLGELPVTEAEIRFQIQRQSVTDRTDANLKVDSVEFGPTLPAL